MADRRDSQRRFDVRFQFVERLADGALQFRLRWLEPVNR